MGTFIGVSLVIILLKTAARNELGRARPLVSSTPQAGENHYADAEAYDDKDEPGALPVCWRRVP